MKQRLITHKTALALAVISVAASLQGCGTQFAVQREGMTSFQNLPVTKLLGDLGVLEAVFHMGNMDFKVGFSQPQVSPDSPPVI